MGTAGKGPVWGQHGGGGVQSEQIAIGLVGIKHVTGTIGDQCALRQIVDEGLGDVVPGMALAEMQDADGAGEQAEDADDGKAGENGEHDRFGHLARDHGEPNGRGPQRQGQKHDQAHARVAAGAVGYRIAITHGGIDVGHGGKIADSNGLRAGLRRFRRELARGSECIGSSWHDG